MTFSFVTLTLDKYDGSGNLVTQGQATCRLSAAAAVPGTGAVPSPVTVSFEGNPAPQVRLVALDTPGLQPAGAYWVISYDWVPGNPDPDCVSVLLAGGPSQLLSSLSPPQSVMPMPAGQPAIGNVPAVTSLDPLAVSWQASSSADKSFACPFGPASTVAVSHNLGKYPAVTVVDSAGDECEGDVAYISASSLTVTFSAPFSGTVYCN